MAFFGLTALGPQNSWAELIRGSFVVEVFSDEEFTAAFDYMAVDGKLSGEADLTKTLERVYHGDVPDDELASFLAAVPREEDGTITKESLMAGVIDMRAQAADFFFDWKQKTSGACDFRSVNLMREHHLRNQLPKKGPTDKYIIPVTAAQEVGWHQKPEHYKPPMYGNSKGEETAYQEELIKCGVGF
jgi:hypothetical protein